MLLLLGLPGSGAGAAASLVGRRIRLGTRAGSGGSSSGGGYGDWLVRSDHDRVLYREARAANPLVGAGEPLRELVLDALPLLLELHEPLPSLAF